MDEKYQLFWEDKRNIVLFGLSRNLSTVSHSVFQLLQGKGYQVFPVNPNAARIGQIMCFQKLEQIQEQLDAAVIITNPVISLTVVKECVDRNIWALWFQLHTMNEAVRELCETNSMNYINDCLLHYPEIL